MPEWERVPLGEVIRLRKEFITIDDLTTYKRCRVQVRAQGIVLRDEVPGSTIKTKKQQVCRAGEFLVAEIDAKMGGFGIVPPELEGAVVSSHYFLFEIDEAKLDRDFLDLYSKTPEFMEQIAAQGSTNYAAIRPSHVLGYTMPLPPLPEQQRIVARVKSLLAKVEEATRLREEVNALRQQLLNHQFAQQFDKAPSILLGEMVNESGFQNGYSPSRSETSSLLGLSLSGIRNGAIDPSHTKPISADRDCTPYIMKRGDIYIVRGSGSKDLVGQAAIYRSDAPIVFPDLLIRINLQTDKILPDYFIAYWNSPINRNWLRETAQTTSGIWKVNQKQLRFTPIPLPTMSEQENILKSLHRIKKIGDALDCETQAFATKLQALPVSILAQAFAGAL